jgi:hypothetical protein
MLAPAGRQMRRLASPNRRHRHARHSVRREGSHSPRNRIPTSAFGAEESDTASGILASPRFEDRLPFCEFGSGLFAIYSPDRRSFHAGEGENDPAAKSVPEEAGSGFP